MTHYRCESTRGQPKWTVVGASHCWKDGESKNYAATTT